MPCRAVLADEFSSLPGGSSRPNRPGEVNEIAVAVHVDEPGHDETPGGIDFPRPFYLPSLMCYPRYNAASYDHVGLERRLAGAVYDDSVPQDNIRHFPRHCPALSARLLDETPGTSPSRK